MTDAALVDELAAAAKRAHVELTDDEREFVKRLRGRDELTPEQRERAAAIFARRVDW